MNNLLNPLGNMFQKGGKSWNDRTYLVQSLYWLHLHLCLVQNLNKKWTNELIDQFKCSGQKRVQTLLLKSKSKANQERKRVGSPEFGYIDIPSKWVKFVDVDVEGLVQYTDRPTYNIVTMNAISKAEAEVGGETFNAETIAQRVAYNWSQKDNLEKMWELRIPYLAKKHFNLTSF